MKKVPVDVFKCAEQILRGVKNAALMTTKSGDGFVNTMVIGWGMLGIAFGRPAFQVFAQEAIPRIIATPRISAITFFMKYSSYSEYQTLT